MQPHRKGSHRLRTGRKSLTDHYYLLTMSTHERRPFLHDDRAAALVIDSLKWLDANGRMELTAAVVMPDHAHWVARLTAGGLARIVHSFKSYSAKKANRVLRRTGPFWQPQYHDHAIRTDESLRDTVEYCLANPVRAGLAKDIHQYRHWWCCWEV